MIGVGNAARGDDAAGLIAARRLGGIEHEADPLALLDVWDGAESVVVIDAVRSGAAPGTIHRFDATEPLPAALRSSTSTHAVGLAETIELARALGRLPGSLVVYGVEGERFDAGADLTPAVSAGIDAAVRAIQQPAVVVVDESALGPDGSAWLPALVAGFPQTWFIVVGMHDHPAYVTRAREAGAADYVLLDDAASLGPAILEASERSTPRVSGRRR